MQIHMSATMLFVTLNVVAVEALVPITVYNQCSESIELFDNNVIETVVSGGTTIRTLSQGFSATLCNGVNAQATLAEFSVVDGFLNYGINIIPIGVMDPNSCTSLETCKAVTGRTGYNTPMQISPAGCTTVTCLEDGCADAYHFPTDDTKAHKCTDLTSVVVTFCPGGSEGLLQQQQQQSAPLPTIDASISALTPSSAYVPTMEASPPVPTIQGLPQLETETTMLTPTEASMLTPTEASMLTPTEASAYVPTTAASMLTPLEVSVPAIDASKSNVATLIETPIVTPSTLAGSKVKSCDGDYEDATALPKMESKTDISATVGTAADTASKATEAPIVDAPSTSTPAPVTQAASPLPSKPYEENAQSANTQSSADDGTGASTYVGTGLGLMAVVAIVAVVVVAHKKKENVGETEEKEFNQEDVMTPVTQINVL